MKHKTLFVCARRLGRARLRSAAGVAASALLGVLGAQFAAAAVFPDLYTLTVTRDLEAPATQAEAEALAMRQLLTRITGDRGAGDDPQLQGLIENASGFVASFAFLDQQRQRAQVGFYPNVVDRELESLNRSVWGPERPLTLLWIAIDGGQGERTLLSADGSAEAGLSPQMTELIASIRDEIRAAADERGLPIALPLLDLEDMGRITFADVWGGFDDTIQAASVRYGADAILIGRVRVTAFGNSVQWMLLRDDERRSFAGAGGLAEGLHWAADTFARDYSVVGGVRTVRILVRGVGTLADYGRVMSYLEGLSTVQTVDVESFDGELLSLRAAARGDPGVLERTLALGRVLQLDEGAGPAVENGSNTLVLRVAQ